MAAGRECDEIHSIWLARDEYGGGLMLNVNGVSYSPCYYTGVCMYVWISALASTCAYVHASANVMQTQMRQTCRADSVSFQNVSELVLKILNPKINNCHASHRQACVIESKCYHASTSGSPCIAYPDVHHSSIVEHMLVKLHKLCEVLI